jgi:hypothetical protein
MRTSCFILGYFFFVVSVKAQQADSTRWKFGLNDCKLSIGYLYQEEHVFEAGIKFDYKQGKKWPVKTISVIPGIQYTKNEGIAYINPYVMLRYFHPLNKKIAVAGSTSWNYRKERNITSSAITPEIGIVINSVGNFSYGYNLFIDNKFPGTSPHRLAFRLMLF